MEKYHLMAAWAQETFRRRLNQVEIELTQARISQAVSEIALAELENKLQLVIQTDRRIALAMGQDSENSQLSSLPDELALLIALKIEQK
jgi:hypothetical protein